MSHRAADDSSQSHSDRSISDTADLFTLRAWLQAEQALEDGYSLDDTVNFMQDRVRETFGRRASVRYNEFLHQNGLGEDRLGVLLRDTDALSALRAFLLADEEAPERPAATFEWRA